MKSPTITIVALLALPICHAEAHAGKKDPPPLPNPFSPPSDSPKLSKDAQERKQERMERLYNAWLEEMESELNAVKSTNSKKMKLRLQFLDRALGLEKPQLEKLGLAQLGAVERATQAWLEYREKQWRAEQNNQYLREQEDHNLTNPVMQDVWTNALENTLTPQQQRKYQAEIGMRFTYFGYAVLQSKLSSFDQQAFLTREQRETIHAKLQAYLAIPIKDVSPKSVLLAVNKAFQRITPEEQKAIFSTEQQAAWHQFLLKISESLEHWEYKGSNDIFVNGALIDI
jgi:hypothetical protein